MWCCVQGLSQRLGDWLLGGKVTKRWALKVRMTNRVEDVTRMGGVWKRFKKQDFVIILH